MSDPIDSPRGTDLAFTPAVRDIQKELGSCKAMERLGASGRWDRPITPDLAAFLESRVSVYLGTASAAGRPYIQHRGGPPGFLRVEADREIVWEEFAGNRQYITFGNLAENDRAFLMAMDYPTRRRVKLWGRARVEGLEQAATGGPMPCVRFRMEAWDTNCPRNIPELYPVEAIRAATAKLTAALTARDARISELEARLAGMETSA